MKRERGGAQVVWKSLAMHPKGQSRHAVSKAHIAALKALSEDCSVRIHGADQSKIGRFSLQEDKVVSVTDSI